MNEGFAEGALVLGVGNCGEYNLFFKREVLVQKKCIFAVSFYHTAQVTKTVSVDVFDSDVQYKTEVSLRSF